MSSWAIAYFFYTFHGANIKIIWDDILGELSLNFK